MSSTSTLSECIDEAAFTLSSPPVVPMLIKATRSTIAGLVIQGITRMVWGWILFTLMNLRILKDLLRIVYGWNRLLF